MGINASALMIIAMQAKTFTVTTTQKSSWYNIMIHKETRSQHFFYPHPLPSNEKLSPRKKETGAEVSHLRKHLRNKEENFVLPG